VQDRGAEDGVAESVDHESDPGCLLEMDNVAVSANTALAQAPAE
jgi:hypothetical protein